MGDHHIGIFKLYFLIELLRRKAGPTQPSLA
jgi:hypothetical protein